MKPPNELTHVFDEIFGQLARNIRATLERAAEDSGIKRGTRSWCVYVEANPFSKAARENVHEIDGICIWCGRIEHDPD